MQATRFNSGRGLCARRPARGVLGLCAILLAASVGCNNGGPGPQLRDDPGPTASSGSSAMVGSLDEARLEQLGFRSLWKTPTGGAIVQSYISGGNLYLVRPGADHPYILEKLDGVTGLTLWTYALQGTLDSAPTAYSYPAELQGVKSPELFFVIDDELVGLDDANGSKNFSVRLSFPASTAPVADLEHVFLGSLNRRFYAIDKESRLESWSYITEDSITAAPAVGDANVYFASEDHTVYGVTRGGGYVPGRSWRYETNSMITASPVLYGDRIFVSSHDYKVYCLEDTGPEAYTRWSYPCGAPVVTAPFPFGDSVFVVTRAMGDGGASWSLHAINCIYGRLQWEAPGVSEVLAADGVHVYARSNEGVQAYRIDNGQLDWTLDLGGYDQVLGQDAEQGRNTAWWGRMFLIDDSGVVEAIVPNR